MLGTGLLAGLSLLPTKVDAIVVVSEAIADLIASNATFRPEANITKAEWLGMLVKAACGDDYSYNASQAWTWQEQVVAYASTQAITSSFTDYDTNATRGWVFEVWANAMLSCGEDKEALEILEELLEGL